MTSFETGEASRGAAAGTRPRRAVSLIVSDEVTSRRAQAALGEGFEVTATTPELASAHPPDTVVVACDRASLLNGSEVGDLRARLPVAALIVVCPADDPRAVRAALAAGADAFVHEAAVDQALPAAAHAVAAGQVCVPRAARDLFGGPALSYREKQVLQLVAGGLTNGQIALRMCLAESTVKSHLSTAYRKLGVRSRREAVAVVLNPESGLQLQVLD